MSQRVGSLPPAFVKLVAPLLAGRLDAFLACFEEPSQHALRASARRLFPSLPFLGEPVPWARAAWYLKDGAKPGAHPLHWAGAYYLQEPSAMAAAEALNPKPGEKVLDLCAAPGGKACQIGDMLAGEGLLLANDPVPQRARELSRNLERMGIRNAVVTCEEPARLAAALPEYFDKILVDAPCSGEGMFRKDPEALARWTPDLPPACAARQQRILDSAALMLKPGGRLVYSTCTFNRLENEEVIAGFLSAHRDFYLLPFSLPGLPPAPEGQLRLWPFAVRGEGHFIALLERAGDEDERTEQTGGSMGNHKNDPAPALCSAINRALPDWVSETLTANAVFGDVAVQLPPVCPPLDGLRVLRLGLHLGSSLGKTIRPEHALALAAQPKVCFEVGEEAADAYRRGFELPAPEGGEGWAAPCLMGWPLGWGKLSAGRCKNHYPKGLRKHPHTIDS